MSKKGKKVDSAAAALKTKAAEEKLKKSEEMKLLEETKRTSKDGSLWKWDWELQKGVRKNMKAIIKNGEYTKLGEDRQPWTSDKNPSLDWDDREDLTVAHVGMAIRGAKLHEERKESKHPQIGKGGNQLYEACVIRQFVDNKWITGKDLTVVKRLIKEHNIVWAGTKAEVSMEEVKNIKRGRKFTSEEKMLSDFMDWMKEDEEASDKKGADDKDKK